MHGITCPAHLILLDLINLLLDEEYKLQGPSLQNFLHLPVVSKHYP